jgi:dipeptidyl aminopeptidase/acylaminoacyl peptidase
MGPSFLRNTFAFALAAALVGQAPAKRPLKLDDLNRFHDLGAPEVSPDGKWIAYTVSSIDKEADKRVSNLWMVSWDGTQTVQLTNSPESDGSPRWSPDGKFISFTSSRPGKAKGSQVWVLDRRGGDARQLTDIKGSRISEYQWSPDSKKLLLTMRESDDPEADGETPPAGAAPKPPKPPKPIVIDRYHFKQDIQGYLGVGKHSHIYLFDTDSHKLEQITNDDRYDETNAVLSPDGARIAFVSNHDSDPDRSHNSDVFIVDAKTGATPRKLTAHEGPDGGRLAWSSDSKLIAYTQGSDPKYSAYNLNRLALVPADGGQPRVVTGKLDRGVSGPVFGKDNTSIFVLVSDDRSEYPAQVSLANGSVERLIGMPIAVTAQSRAGGHAAVMASTDDAPSAIFALEGSGLRKLTTHNDALISELQLGATEDVNFKSKDGAEIHGIITKPPAFESGRKYPLLLRIHGGPNGQDQHSFNFERQFFAANGYVVLNVNYRGSSGRGSQYQETIFADWGNKEVADLLAGVDHVIAMGLADPERLGIGGWSYGGILTDYTIATDTRFKAAISGAGSANQIAMYGVDQYTLQYDQEIGPPWKNPEAWIKISYPFYKADRIRTPTLFMGGDKDFNVPIVGGEQMYQALRSLGVPTELVVYPGQNHGFTRPSFIRDRYERYLAWYDKYLKQPVATTTAGR